MPANAPEYHPSTAGLAESPESPVWEYGEIITVTKVYRGPFATCKAAAKLRGYVGIAADGDMEGYQVVRSVVQKETGRGGVGKLSVTWQPTGLNGGDPGLQLPVDELALDPFEINPKLAKHPNYSALDEKTLDNCKVAVDGATDALRDEARAKVAGVAAALELIEKYKLGIENWYLCGFEYKWTFHSWTLPAMTVGGFIEAPGGPLAATIIAAGFSCLRLGDALATVNGAYYRCTRSWKVAPAGHWDTDIY